MLWIFLLALSATIDSWAVGMAYKVQNIQIPTLAKWMISLVSGVTAGIALVFSNLLGEVVPMVAIQRLGGILLILMGIKALWQIKTERKQPNYDRDFSKKIEMWEAIWMGMLLSLDSFCVGIGLMPYGSCAYAFPPLVAAFTIGFLMLSQRISYQKFLDYVAGLILVAAGVCTIFI